MERVLLFFRPNTKTWYRLQRWGAEVEDILLHFRFRNDSLDQDKKDWCRYRLVERRDLAKYGVKE